MKKKLLLFIVFCILIPFSLYAQWSSNSALNSTICDETGEQALAKVAVCPDGSSYISWFDNRGGSYAVYIQRLNPLGVKQFASTGLLVSGNPQSSSLVDYDLITDDSSNAILAFTDTRNGTAINPFAYKISPAGTFLWGANGITLSDSVTSYQPNPHVVKASDGNFIFVWRIGSGPVKIAMQKLSPSGVKMWGAGPILLTSGTTENFDWPWQVASDNGSIILYWAGYTGTFLSPQNYKLYTQKFSSTGTRVWNATQDTVYSLGRVSGFYTPRVFPDGNNGAIYTWQDDRNSTNQSNCYAQRKSSAGTFLFPVNGSAVATSSGMLRFTPIATIIPSTQETFVFWQHKNTLQSVVGIQGQKFSATGARLWTDTGYVFKPLDANSFSSLYAYTRDSNVIVSYLELVSGGVNGLIKAFRTTRSGIFGWGGSIITPGSSVSEKTRMSADLTTNGMSILAWEDKRNGDGGMYAQNINYNGSFGPPSGIININSGIPSEYKLLQNYPNPFNPSTKISFSIPENGNVRIIVSDILGREVSSVLNSYLATGNYSFDFNAANLAGGIYFYKMIVNSSSREFTDTRKMLLVK